MGGGGGDTNTHTAGCKQIGEIMAIATKLYVPIAGLSPVYALSYAACKCDRSHVAKSSDGGAGGGPVARNIAVIIAMVVSSSSSSLSLESRELTLRKHLRRRSFRALYTRDL